MNLLWLTGEFNWAKFGGEGWVDGETVLVAITTLNHTLCRGKEGNPIYNYAESAGKYVLKCTQTYQSALTYLDSRATAIPSYAAGISILVRRPFPSLNRDVSKDHTPLSSSPLYFSLISTTLQANYAFFGIDFGTLLGSYLISQTKQTSS